MSRLSASIAALLALGLSARAWADPLQPLAGPAIEGDGQTPHTVLVACPSCTAADKLRVKGDGLTLTGSSVDDDGFLHLDLVAEPVAAPTQRRISLRVQQASGKLEADLNLQVLPPRAAAIGLRLDVDAVEAGGPPVKLSWEAPPGPLDPAAARYAISASVGSLGPVSVAADGSASATWTPPATALAPERVLFGVVDLRAPDQRMGLGSLPLRARTSLSLKVEPDSENVLVVDGERFGPVRASPSGTVAFEVALPPSLGKGSLETTTKTGERRSQAVDLPLGKGALHLILPLPPAVPADPTRPLGVWVARVDRAGAPLSGAAPTLSSSRGELGPMEEGVLPGLYRAAWKAPAQVGTVEFLAEADGRRSEAQARLIEGLPSLRLEVEPERLEAKATSLSVRATVTPPEGGLSRAAPPRLDLAGARLLARPKLVTGAWTSSFRVPASGEVVVQAVGEQPSSGLPPARLLAWAGPADPKGRVPITLVAVDALGLPVPGLDLVLAVPKGAGSLPPTGKTGPSGELFIAYDPQGDAAPAELTLGGGGLSLSLGLLPGGPSTHAAGTETHRELLARWQALLPRQVVPREGAAVVAGRARQRRSQKRRQPGQKRRPQPPAPQRRPQRRPPQRRANPSGADCQAASRARRQRRLGTAGHRRLRRGLRSRPAGRRWARWARRQRDRGGQPLRRVGTPGRRPRPERPALPQRRAGGHRSVGWPAAGAPRPGRRRRPAVQPELLGRSALPHPPGRQAELAHRRRRRP